MRMQFILNKLIPRAFNLLRVNLNLAMPLLMFLLLIVVIISPLAGINNFIRLAIVALISVFLSGWLNMFHSCIENSQNENLSDEKKTMDSLNLYTEFFPGVAKHFLKILGGFLLFVLIINLVEFILLKSVGKFQSISLESFFKPFNTQAEVMNFWNSINPADKIKLYKLAAYNMAFITIFSYLTMFWMHFVIVENKNSIKAFLLSVKAVLTDPINTSLMFLLSMFGTFIIFTFNAFLGANFLGQLLILMLFVYFMVYYVMMTFLYFERYR